MGVTPRRGGALDVTANASKGYHSVAQGNALG